MGQDVFVDTGVGQSPQGEHIAYGPLRAPVTPGTYTFRLTRASANTLHVVNVDTASGNRDEGGHELSLVGLVAPEEFKKDVWQMKRGEQVAGVSGTVAPMAVSMARDGGAGMGAAPALSTSSLEAKIDEQTAVLKELLEVMKAFTAK